MYYGYKCCGGVQLAADGDDVAPAYLKHINDLSKKIFDAKQAPIIDDALLTNYGNQLTRAAMKGFGIDPNKFDWNAKDSKVITQMLQNVWQFSAAKTHQQLRDMGAALVNPNGSYRDWKEFAIATNQIGKTYVHWLKAEVQNAIGGAQMIALWNKIQAEKDIFPFLQFDAVQDKGTTALCAYLDGKIFPVDHWIWQIYFPLNHWGCRSTVRQLRRGTFSEINEDELPELPKMFATNIAQTGLIFPEDHTYFVGAPPELYEAARYRFNYHAQFNLVEESESFEGLVREHFQIQKIKDYASVLEIAMMKARDNGALVDILEAIPYNILQRDIIFFGAKEGKSPDIRINGKLVEIKRSNNSINPNNLKHAIDAAAKQADHIIIRLNNDVTGADWMSDLIAKKFADHKDLQIIELEYNGVFTQFTRK